MTSVPLAVQLIAALGLGNADAGEGRTFQAVDYARLTIYHSPEKPGFTSWVGAWIMPDGDLMTCFTQATGAVKGRPQAPKDVQEKLNWPPKGAPGYDMTGLELKNVHLRSSDAGKTWKQVSADSFKSCMNGVTGEAQTALAHGTVIRGVFGFYLPYDRDVPQTGFLQRSSDGTKTWGKPEVLLDPEKYTTWPRRIRVLRNGRIVVLMGVGHFPAGSRSRVEFGKAVKPMLVVSADNGKTWEGPIAAVPQDQPVGWTEEFDVAELAKGDLLAVFRRANDAKRWQSVLKKSDKSWVAGKAGPAVLPHSGQPELLATREGPILHVATNGVHWTDDAGKSWHKLNVPGPAYYPRSVQGRDGTIFIFGHVGGDDAYGKVDQSIVMDSFKFEKVQPPALVREIGSRRELFVDDYLIDKLKGAGLKMHTPIAQDIAIVCDAPWEGNTSAYYTLFADGDRFRMYYRGAHFDEKAKKPTHPEYTCYAESKDGIRWEKPKLGLFEFKGTKENNIVWSGAGTHNFTPFKDGNPKAPARSRYKALAAGRGGLIAYQSSDGIHWSSLGATAVITDGAFDSQNLAFWDDVRGEYRAYWRFFAKASGHRAIRTATSKDFIRWQNQADLQYGDSPSEHLYTNAIQKYFRAPHLFLGLPTRFQPKHQQVEPILMTSRDGVNFKRWPQPLIPITAPKDRDGNRSNYLTSGLLQLPGKPNELSVYATEAYYAGPGSRVRRFTFRTDGFVSLHAGADVGEMITKPLRFSGRELVVNYSTSAGGSVRVEFQDEAGKPLPGFALGDCKGLAGDATEQKITWAKGSDVASLAGQTVRLRFVLLKADLYCLQFTK